MELELPAEARALLDAVVAIGSDLDLRGVLRRIVVTSCELTGAQYGVLGTVDPDVPFAADENGAFLDLVVHGFTERQVEKIGILPMGHGLIGAVPQQRTSMRVDRISDHPDSVGFPDHHPPIDRFLGAPVLVGERAFGHLYLGKSIGGEPFTTTDQALVEALAKMAGVLIANARAYDESERRRAWLDASVRISSALAPTARAEEAVELLVNQVLEVTSARAVALVQEVDGLLEITAEAGSEVIRGLVDRLADDVRAVRDAGGPQRLEHKRGAVHLVPMRSKLATPGVVVVLGGDESRGPLEDDLLAAFAGQLGVALDRAEAILERQELLLAKDRDRIARDLHDVVIQRLFAAGMQLQGIKNLDIDLARERAAAVIGELDLAMKDLRATIYELGRGSHGSLLEDVRRLLREYAVVLGFVPILRTNGPVDRALAEGVAGQVVAVIREALSNIARHAAATSAKVELSATSAWFVVRVSDDGRGFAAAPAGGNGLGNLRHRAEALGGHLSVTCDPGQGTTLEWVVPAVG